MLSKTTITRRVQEFVNRRKEPRFFADDEVILVVGQDTHVARLTDRSRCGMGIVHTRALRVGDVLNLITPSETLAARVVWSNEDDGTYRSGLMIDREGDSENTRNAARLSS